MFVIVRDYSLQIRNNHSGETLCKKILSNSFVHEQLDRLKPFYQKEKMIMFKFYQFSIHQYLFINKNLDS